MASGRTRPPQAAHPGSPVGAALAARDDLPPIRIGRALGWVLPGGHSDTLVTKTMLGVFGCVPAFDSYFRRGIGTSGFRPSGMRKVAGSTRLRRSYAAYRGMAVAGCDPEVMGIRPAYAVPKLLAQAGLTDDDISI